ncbi:transglutaminase family protein [Aquimarina sp. AD1]|uniref:transglutaminase-like domain-containing protein n=1 Tax=Aquimarina sp. (strain AD1) TaxID=1714848 RepID=UPI000E4E01A0|nr:transglutaminase family protein [Aquimarina sp. AD1]AXT55504.1 transglutaminase family protein [Aquimarina sp. AD1]RKN36012.1 transglutaminase family protein [Aquimarina sp. AD1]
MDYLAATYYYDYETEEIQKIIEEFKSSNVTLKEKAKALYIKVRDGWRYDPYHINLKKEAYKASKVATKNSGHCLDKSILLIAGLRGLGIPARIHLAKVKNHIGVERLIEKFGTNELTPHGMVNVYLDGKWVKASPAFNKALCEKCNVAPLEFDGENDSMFQEFDNKGGIFMEYLEDYGHFEDVPFDFILNNIKEHYTDIYEKYKELSEIRL